MGLIYNIQHFSLHDGPGVRTVIFFKGCNLKCRWCHNPESIGTNPGLMFYGEKCIGCNACIDICPSHCLTIDEAGLRRYDNTDCLNCFRCVDRCYAEALSKVGESVSTEYIMDAILSNKAYFKQSGGGVTFSGGECMLQIDFLRDLLIDCKNHDLHTAVDTAGHLPFSYFERIMPYTDLFLYDFKAFSEERHISLTGVTNKLIKHNFEALVAAGCKILVRIPLAPLLNDDEIPLLAEYMNRYPAIPVELLPYHSLGSSKYAALGAAVAEPTSTYTPSDDETARAKRLFLTAI